MTQPRFSYFVISLPDEIIIRVKLKQYFLRKEYRASKQFKDSGKSMSTILLIFNCLNCLNCWISFQASTITKFDKETITVSWLIS